MSWIKKHKEGGASPSSLLLLPVVLLVLGSGISGLLMEEQEPITVEEGYEEMNVEYRENLVEETDLTDKYYDNKTCTSVTTVNDNYTLELNVEMFMSSITGIDDYQTKIKLSVEGDFSSDLKPDEIRFTAKGLEGKDTSKNALDFLTSQNDCSNASFVGWEETEKISPGARGEDRAYVTFDVEEGKFDIETEIQMVIDESNIGDEYSYRFQGIAAGLSQEVRSTIKVTFLER